MSKVLSLLIAPGVVLASALCSQAAPVAGAPADTKTKTVMAVPLDKSELGVAHFDSYVKPDGAGYFALSLSPDANVPAPAGNDIVVLFDTSASQAGPFREKALDVLRATLRELPPEARVQLFGMDLKPAPMCDGFVSPQGDGMLKAMAALLNRAPLGATDLPLALDAARRALAPEASPTLKGADAVAANKSAEERARAILYIGDGQSIANLMTTEDFAAHVQKLAAEHISVSCFAVGPREDSMFLAALANQTGGMLAVDAESTEAVKFGHYLAAAAVGTVLWPTEVKWPAELGDVYPAKLPPLRMDREAVVVGLGKPRAEISVEAKATAYGRVYSLSWKTAPGDSNDDFAFLAQLVQNSKADAGLTLPTVGRTGLLEVGRMYAANEEALAKLSNQAIAMGNFADAEKLSDEALRRDPRDEVAQAVKRKLSAIRGGGKTPTPAKGKLKLEKSALWQVNPPTQIVSRSAIELDDRGGIFAVPDGPSNNGPSNNGASNNGASTSNQAAPKAKGTLRLGPTSPTTGANASAPNAGAAGMKPGEPQAAGAKFNLPAADKAKKAAAQKVANSKEESGPIHLTIVEGSDPNVVWNDYFATHPNVSPSAVRETARELMHKRQFDYMVALIQSALRQGQPQPWMYEAMGLALEASGQSKDEIERALTSGIDLSDSADDSMSVAIYMARSGLEERALKIFRQVGVACPLRPEPFAQGLRLAQRLNDADGIRWSSLGILRQAWTEEQRQVWESGVQAALALLEQYKTEKRQAEHDAFQAEIDVALERDCIVTVSWTGDADVDMYVEEPPGTICSFRTPRTASGGIMLGDTASMGSKANKDGYSETYVCPQAFSGNYRVLLRRVWGKVTAGKVTVDVYAHFGGKQSTRTTQQIPLSDQDAGVVFQLTDGRRADSLDQELVNNAILAQTKVNQTVNRMVLAQQLNALSSSSAAGDMGVSRAGLFGGFNAPFMRGLGGSVGYSPVISSLPTGARMTAQGVISADRRYVRIEPFPFFSQIGEVFTFNIASGANGVGRGGNTNGGGGAGLGGGGGGRGAF